MIDPIGAFNTIGDNFLLYLRTAFGTRFPSIDAERDQLLREDGRFRQEPWIEPLPRYQGSGKKAAGLASGDVPGLTGGELADFQGLIRCGLVGDYELRSHQVEMLRTVCEGRNAVVTAGTGSGKTESFLLPLFAYLAKESRGWDAPGLAAPHAGDWWSSREWHDACHETRPLSNEKTRTTMKESLFVPQRGHEERPAAMRALILYPMNALVEDQMTRLRRALDSGAAREWFRSHRQGNRIYFGRYNSVTPVAGHERKKGGTLDTGRIRRLQGALKALDQSARAAGEHAGKPGNDPDVRYFFPRLDGAEMRSRWDMQAHPPDILITNYSMLSIMLMRDADSDIFEKTKTWLERDGSVFHLIVDELHLYRGTAGTEVAYLLRLLLRRLGLSPDSPKLRILASSASLEADGPDAARSLAFLEDFSGARWETSQIIRGRERPAPGVAPGTTLNAAPFATLAAAVDSGDPMAVDSACRDVAESLGASGGASGREALEGALGHNDTVGAVMLQACADDEGRPMAVAAGRFAAGVFGAGLPGADREAALRGLLIARGLCGDPGDLPSFRLHLFFRNIEGLWACTMPGCGCTGDEEGRPAGRLFAENGRLLCGNVAGEHRVLELLYCEQCGTVFFGGRRLALPDNGGWELLQTEPDIEGIPDRQVARLVERRSYGEYVVFWPCGMTRLHPEAKQWKQPGEDGALDARWTRASLDTGGGMVRLGWDEPCAPDGPWVRGYLFHLPRVQEDQEDGMSALPSVCPSCAADYKDRKYRRSPARGFRTGFNKVSQLLAKELFYQLGDEESGPGQGSDGRRKLVVFSDSREDAAGVANGIERSHYPDLLREVMFGAFTQLAAGAAGRRELLEDLQAQGTLVRPAAVAYAGAKPGEAREFRRWLRDARQPIPDDAGPEEKEDLLAERGQAEQRIAATIPGRPGS